MFGWLNSLRRDRRGAAVVEFALFAPLFLLMLIGVIEFGRLLAQSNAVEKGLRAGAMLAARSDFPLTADQRQRIQNVVMTGNVDATAPLLVDGWAKAGAGLVIETSTFTSGGVIDLPVIRLEATVPYAPLIPGLMSSFGFDNLKIETAHEQARIGY